jgi:hypothetical protein
MVKSFKPLDFVCCLLRVSLIQARTFTDNFAGGLDPADWSVIQTTPGLYTKVIL